MKNTVGTTASAPVQSGAATYQNIIFALQQAQYHYESKRFCEEGLPIILRTVPRFWHSQDTNTQQMVGLVLQFVTHALVALGQPEKIPSVIKELSLRSYPYRPVQNNGGGQ